jgi:serine/threonine protein kinase
MMDNSQGNDSTRATPSLPPKDVTLNSRAPTLGSRELLAPRVITSSQFQPGDLIDGRYQVMSVIGSGGFGCVYRVHQILLKKNFALKTLNPVNMSEVTMLRLRKEAQTASRLEHENLVKAVDFGMIDLVQPYLVMDLVEGPTLAEYLKEHGRLPVAKALEIFMPWPRVWHMLTGKVSCIVT